MAAGISSRSGSGHEEHVGHTPTYPSDVPFIAMLPADYRTEAEKDSG